MGRFQLDPDSESRKRYGLLLWENQSILRSHMQQWGRKNAASQLGKFKVRKLVNLIYILFTFISIFSNMVGVEYILLHVQDPILYVIRKQHRHSLNDVTPIADFYIIAGTIYQAPDLASVFNSRILSAVNHLQSAFEEVSSYAKYQVTFRWSISVSPSS